MKIKLTIQERIERCKSKPCKKGHSKQDAYVFVDPFTGLLRVNCKTCAALRYKKVPVSKSIMDEESYQKYKFAMLLDWLQSEVRQRKYILADGKELLGQVKTQVLICTTENCGQEFLSEEIDKAIAHLGEHYPQYFVDGNGRK